MSGSWKNPVCILRKVILYSAFNSLEKSVAWSELAEVTSTPGMVEWYSRRHGLSVLMWCPHVIVVPGGGHVFALTLEETYMILSNLATELLNLVIQLTIILILCQVSSTMSFVDTIWELPSGTWNLGCPTEVVSSGWTHHMLSPCELKVTIWCDVANILVTCPTSHQSL